MVIGLPPVVLFGKEAMREQVVLPVLRGDKRIALAISEPFAGSDVAGLKTTARKSACGQYVREGRGTERGKGARAR